MTSCSPTTDRPSQEAVDVGPSGQDEQTIAEYTNKLIAHVQRRWDNPGTTSRIGCPITPNNYPLIIAHLRTLSLDDDLHEKAKKVASSAALRANYYAKPGKKQKKKEHNAIYYAKPGKKQKRAEYKAKPESKQKRAEYNARPGNKQKRAEYKATYSAKPENKQKRAAYQKAYYERKKKEEEQKSTQEPYQNQ